MGMLDSLTEIKITARDATQAAFASVEKGVKSLSSSVSVLGGALGVAAFGTMMKSAIDAADQVNKLTQQTGIAAAEIDKLTIVAKLNDIEASSLVKSYKALSTAMNEASDPASKQAKAFAAIGVATRDAQGNMRSLGDMTKDLAGVFAAAKDGPEKLAVATALFGKAGADLIPMLNNMAEDMDRAAKVQQAFGEVSKTTAANADTFNDSMTLLGEGLRRMFLPAVDSLGPSMGRFADSMLAVNAQGSALTPVLRGLFDNVLPAAVETIGALIISADALAKSLGNLLGGLAAALVQLSKGDFSQAWETAKSAWADSGQIIEQSNKAIGMLMDRSKQATPVISATADATNSMARAASALAESAGKAGKRFDDYSDAIKRFNDQIKDEAKTSEERWKWFQKVEDSLNDIYKAEFETVKAIDNATAAYQKQIDALTKTEDAILREAEAQLESNIAQIEAIGGRDDNTEAMQRQLDVLNKLIAARENKEAVDAAAKAAKEAEDAWKRTADSIENSLTDALMRGFEGGKNWAKNFGATLKNMFSTLVLRPVIQAVLAPVAGGAASLFSGGASASSGGIGNLGGLGSLFGGSFGSGASISMSNISELGLLGGTAANFGNIGGQLASGSFGAAAGMAMPYIGAAAAVGSLLYSLLGKRDPSQVRGQFQVGGSGFEDNAYVASRFGSLGFADAGTQQFSGEAAKGFSQIVAKLLNAAADQMDAGQVARTAQKLSATIFEGLEGTFTTQDFLSKYGADILQQTVSVAFDELNPKLAELMRAFEGSAEEMGGFAETLVQISALTNAVATEFGGDAGIIKQLNSLFVSIGESGISSDDVSNIMAYASAMVSISRLLDSAGTVRGSDKLIRQLNSFIEAIAKANLSQQDVENMVGFAKAMVVVSRNISGGIADDVARMSLSSVGALRVMGRQVITLTQDLHDSADSAIALANATGEYRKAVVETVAAIKQIRASVSEMFESARDSLTTYGMSPEDLYDFYLGKANAAAELLRTTQDPQLVETLARQIVGWTRDAFGSMTGRPIEYPENVTDYDKRIIDQARMDENLALRDTLQGYLDRLQDFTGQRLTDIEVDTINAAEDVFSVVGTSMDQAFEMFGVSVRDNQSAADTQVKAADTMRQAAAESSTAARGLSDAVRMFIAQLPIGVTVNLSRGEVNA